jgi:MoxR-like ATPase
VLIPLVARAGVLAEVDSALAATRAGRGTLLTVTGEPGIGKTRLAEAAAGRVSSSSSRSAGAAGARNGTRGR